MLMPAMRAMGVLQIFDGVPRSALALLVTRVGADHANDARASDDLAVTAHLLHRCGDFHGLLLDPFIWRGRRSARDSNRRASTRPSPCRPEGCGCSASASFR